MIENRVGQTAFTILECKVVECVLEEMKVDKHGVFYWVKGPKVHTYVKENLLFTSRKQLIEQL